MHANHVTLFVLALAGACAIEEPEAELAPAGLTEPPSLALCGRIALRAANGPYVAAEGGGGRELIANRPSPGAWETFTVVPRANGKIALRVANNQFWVAEGGGGGPVLANRSVIGPWEEFGLIELGADRIALRASSGHYVVAEGGGGQPLYANRNAVGAWETFQARCMDAAPPSCFVRRSGDGLVVQGGPFKFVGANLRGIAFRPPQEIRDHLIAAREFGAKTIRIFAVHESRNATDVGNALQQLFNIASQIGPDLRFILSLQDWYDTGFNAQHDDPYYVDGKLVRGWFTGGFRTNYKPMVRALVDRFRNERRIAVWEIGNELQVVDKAAALNFAYEMGWEIKNRGAQQLVSTGYLAVNHAVGGQFDDSTISQVYHGPWSTWPTSPFEVGTIHAYNNDQVPPGPPYNVQDRDIDWFRDKRFPYYVGEGGFNGGLANGCNDPIFEGGMWDGVSIPDATTDRAPAVRATINRFFDAKGADGYMQWGLMVGGDNGEGDRCSGMDTLFHADYPTLAATYRARAVALPGGGTAACN